MVRVAALALALALAMPVASASAFSDPLSFERLALAAGGGGRYFTGSPADGYTCKVCHDGGPEPELNVTGLPLGGYRPGDRYEISVNWSSDVDRFALALELTDEHGQTAGSVRLPPLDEVLPAEYCEPASDAQLAAQISEAPNGRRVIHVPDCGAQRLRFLWTAPATEIGAVWFAGSAVASDGESDPYHDGVTDFARVLASPPVASQVTASCSTMPSSRNARGFCVFALVSMWWLRRTRTRARSRCA